MNHNWFGKKLEVKKVQVFLNQLCGIHVVGAKPITFPFSNENCSLTQLQSRTGAFEIFYLKIVH